MNTTLVTSLFPDSFTTSARDRLDYEGATIACRSGGADVVPRTSGSLMIWQRPIRHGIANRTTIEAIQEDVLAGLENKNPPVKILVNLTVQLKSLTAMKVVGEKVIMPFLPDLEAMKMAKIKECCEKDVVCGKSSGPAKPKAAVKNDVKEATAKPAEAAQKKPGAVIKKSTPAASGSGPPKKTAGKPVARKPAGAGAKIEENLEKELSPFTIFTGGQPKHKSLESSDNILPGCSNMNV
ncbi:hypothetical protein DAPPUDRAFT_240386 [Daphnia pulex]|uniref:Uncharacterized protein n=1 Tax=Daphnia pulex TaxID=6669 RepID=E9GBG2_DAPPU|nr:hypothetical protein DAPPUDRAFT_240386 [Daphnia pulex]|eukprot:EFX83160.1 hypothetical protein DAPPUDRAFT_240386 [Daphnia pulex]